MKIWPCASLSAGLCRGGCSRLACQCLTRTPSNYGRQRERMAQRTTASVMMTSTTACMRLHGRPDPHNNSFELHTDSGTP